MRKIKAHFLLESEKLSDVISTIQEELHINPVEHESSITMRGEEESGLEIIKFSIEEDEIKILVAFTEKSLLVYFEKLFGAPVKIKGLRKTEKKI